MKKNIFLLVLAALTFAACEPTVIEPESLYITEEEVDKIVVAAEDDTIYSLNDFVDEFMTEEGNFLNWKELGLDCPYRTRATNGDGIYLFSIDTLPIAGRGIYIRGRVITEDHAGNFYKSMVIQQIVDGKQQTLRLSVDASSISGQYAIGQEILIRVNGFSIGRYANLPQLCVPTYNNNIYASSAEQKMGWAPGRIPFSRFQKATKRIGLPEKSKILVDTISITEFQSLFTDEETYKQKDTQRAIRHMDGHLVCLKNVYFTGQEEDGGSGADLSHEVDPNYYNRDNNANVFAPSTGGVGFPRSRIISDGVNETLVSNSEYVKFAHYYLPGCDANGIADAPNYKGTVTGILGYYRDNAKNTTYYKPDKWDWSITLRSLAFMGWGTENDLDGFTNVETGELWVPKEYGAKEE